MSYFRPKLTERRTLLYTKTLNAKLLRKKYNLEFDTFRRCLFFLYISTVFFVFSLIALAKVTRIQTLVLNWFCFEIPSSGLIDVENGSETSVFEAAHDKMDNSHNVRGFSCPSGREDYLIEYRLQIR